MQVSSQHCRPSTRSLHHDRVPDNNRCDPACLVPQCFSAEFNEAETQHHGFPLVVDTQRVAGQNSSKATIKDQGDSGEQGCCFAALLKTSDNRGQLRTKYANNLFGSLISHSQFVPSSIGMLCTCRMSMKLSRLASWSSLLLTTTSGVLRSCFTTLTRAAFVMPPTCTSCCKLMVFWLGLIPGVRDRL